MKYKTTIILCILLLTSGYFLGAYSNNEHEVIINNKNPIKAKNDKPKTTIEESKIKANIKPIVNEHTDKEKNQLAQKSSGSTEQKSSTKNNNLAKNINYEDQFQNQEVDSGWSYNQETSILNTFNEQHAIASGILLESVECKTSICKLKVSNYDTSKGKLDLMMLTETVYSSKWSENSTIHFQKTNDINNRIMYLTLNSSN